jgi:peptide/nickel transport system ATP-binding protein
MSAAEITDRSAMLLQRVGLSEDAAHRYPAQFSGGQRQRIAIARSLMLSPRLIVCDEPVSALDLSVQAEVLNLLSELQRDLGLSLLFVSHDLSVVRHISHSIAVLQAGRIVELGTAEQVYERPREEYTRSLLAAAPVPDPAEQRARREERQRRRNKGEQ